MNDFEMLADKPIAKRLLRTQRRRWERAIINIKMVP